MKQIQTQAQVDEARSHLKNCLRDAFSPAAVCFITALYARLKPLYRSIEDFDVKAFGDYATKLETLMDPAGIYDFLRLSLVQPQRGAEEIVAREILKLNEARGDGAGFEPLAYRLFEIDAIAKTHTEDPPPKFIHEAFETYLRTLTTDGHSYYLAIDEVLAIAEASNANVVVTRQEVGCYKVVGYRFGCPGAIAVLVMHGERRGHYGRLCTVSEAGQREADVKASRLADEQRRREEQRKRGKIKRVSEIEQKLRAEAKEEHERKRRRETQ